MYMNDDNENGYRGLTAGERHALKRHEKREAKLIARAARDETEASLPPRNDLEPMLLEVSNDSREQKAAKIQREGIVIASQLQKLNVSLASATIRQNTYEERSSRVKFWQRKNAMRDVGRLQAARERTKTLTEEINKLSSQLEQLKHVYEGL